jgi:hypothetical protein
MLGRSFDARSIHLRESYIAISTYVRSVHIQSLNRRLPCPRQRPRQHGPSTIRSQPFSALTNLKDHSRVPQNEDITQGFPEPPASGLAPNISERNRNAEAPMPDQPSGQTLPSDSGPDSSTGKMLPKRNESSDSGNDSTVRPQEDLTGTESGHDGTGDIQHLSRRYRYMGRALHTALAVYT